MKLAWANIKTATKDLFGMRGAVREKGFDITFERRYDSVELLLVDAKTGSKIFDGSLLHIADTGGIFLANGVNSEYPSLDDWGVPEAIHPATNRRNTPIPVGVCQGSLYLRRGKGTNVVVVHVITHTDGSKTHHPILEIRCTAKSGPSVIKEPVSELYKTRFNMKSDVVPG